MRPKPQSRFVRACGKDLRVHGRLIRVARLEGEGYVFLENPDGVLAGLRTLGHRIDIFTFGQKLLDAVPRYKYPMEWDNVAALPVSTFDHWWARQINDKTRNMVRRASKRGVTVREVSFGEPLVRGIWEIYNETPIRQGKPFPHYGMSLESVRPYGGTFLERSVFIGAFLEERLIGFAKLVSDEDQGQAGLMHILAMVQHMDKAPTNALVAQAVRSCAERRIPYLVYSQFSYGKKKRDSLSDFKQHNGFQRVELPRYYVPLTYMGRIALRLSLHHGLSEHIPEPVAAQFRKVRRFWYGRRFKAVTQAP